MPKDSESMEGRGGFKKPKTWLKEGTRVVTWLKERGRVVVCDPSRLDRGLKPYTVLHDSGSTMTGETI